MILYILAQLYSTLIELLRLSRISADEKDLEILILRQQLDVMERKNNQVVRPSKVEKWSLAVLAAALKKRGCLTTSQLGRVIRIFKPETVIGWHRELVPTVPLDSSDLTMFSPLSSRRLPWKRTDVRSSHHDVISTTNGRRNPLNGRHV